MNYVQKNGMKGNVRYKKKDGPRSSNQRKARELTRKRTTMNDLETAQIPKQPTQACPKRHARRGTRNYYGGNNYNLTYFFLNFHLENIG